MKVSDIHFVLIKYNYCQQKVSIEVLPVHEYLCSKAPPLSHDEIEPLSYIPDGALDLSPPDVIYESPPDDNDSLLVTLPTNLKNVTKTQLEFIANSIRSRELN
jgi:hypothetical protein